MTKIECLEAMVRIWTEVYERSCFWKLDIKEACKYANECPCCQYVIDKSNGTSSLMYKYDCINLCPLKGLWPYGCEDYSNPVFLRWCEGDVTAAKEIADYSQKLLSELKEKNNA